MLGAALLQLAYFALPVLFAPWTLILFPPPGVWYIIFLSQFLLYDRLNKELRIEEQFHRAMRAEQASEDAIADQSIPNR